MRAWQIGESRDIDGLVLGEKSNPEAAAGEVVVKVIAAGLNYRDLMVLRRQYGAEQPAERVPAADGVGIIEAVGEGVTGLEPGDRIIAPHFVTWLGEEDYNYGVFARDLGNTADGWLAEKIALPASAPIKLPESISDQTAATLTVVGATVWHAMVAFGEASPGKLVLAQGTGGISVFSLQLAKALGADFAITSSSDDKLARARDMGADYTVNYRKEENWPEALMAATDGRGADVVVDTLGFPALKETVAACAPNARIGTLGALAGSPRDAMTATQGDLIVKNLTIKGIASGSRAMLAQAVDVVAKNGVEMVVDEEFDFADAPDALRHLESGAHFGKVLVRVS